MSTAAASPNVPIHVHHSESAGARFLWCVRRELWENRSIYLAPIMVAAVALAGYLVASLIGIWETPLRIKPENPQPPYDLLAGLLMFTCIAINVFYSLDALHGERRDRSILFWKSLPVSDTITVLSKASIPLLVVPVAVFAVAVTTQWIMLLWGSLMVAAGGGSVATLWRNLAFVHMCLLLLYHLITAHALWSFPVYCWFLLVSGWARRAALLWAVLPVAVIGGLEAIFFRSKNFAALVFSRLIGDAPTVSHQAAGTFPLGPATHVAPGSFLSSPGFMLGLVFSAICLTLAIRMRRSQGPI